MFLIKFLTFVFCLLISNLPIAFADGILPAEKHREIHNWTGLYIGGNFGNILTRINGDIIISAFRSPLNAQTFPNASQPYDTHKNSFFGGGQVGYAQQWQAWVLGLELDANGFHYQNTQTLTASQIPSGQTYVAGDIFTSNNSFQTALLAKFGYTIENGMIYIIGGGSGSKTRIGATFIQVDVSGVTFPRTVISKASFFTGGTFGGGFEYAFTEHLRLAGEYRYTGYPGQNFVIGSAPVLATSATTFVYSQVVANLDLNTTQVSLKINYQF